MATLDDVANKEIKQTEREILADKYLSALKKRKFINELRNGLGDQIKANPNQINIIKKPWYIKLLKKIFTKF